MKRILVAAGLTHQMPPDLQKMLISTPAAKAAWDSLTPLAKNEWICWVVSNKKPETREHHITRTCAELIEAKRRPCCWAGCIHRKKIKN
jgi:uncharacterized protein YdeI (YjbR/CyaY-like superfamily)